MWSCSTPLLPGAAGLQLRDAGTERFGKRVGDGALGITEHSGQVLPLSHARHFHDATDMGRSLSPDISRYIVAQLDSVGITAWRLI
jgi:hypothetical protein